MKDQLNRLNSLRADFIKWADSNEPNTWELDINKIGGKIDGFDYNDNPVVLLVCSKSKNDNGEWYLCVDVEMDTNIESDFGCYPIANMSNDRIYEIRRIIESWLAKKDMGNLFI